MKQVSRKQIESEQDYNTLKDIGRAFKEDGHNVKLNLGADKLRLELLKVYDEHYSEEEEIIDDEEAPEEVEEDSVEEEASTEAPMEKSADPYDNSKLYHTTVEYNDWETGWSFNPATDKPKPLPEKLSEALKNGLAKGRIKRFIK
jgi:hypothetical protein